MKIHCTDTSIEIYLGLREVPFTGAQRMGPDFETLYDDSNKIVGIRIQNASQLFGTDEPALPELLLFLGPREDDLPEELQTEFAEQITKPAVWDELSTLLRTAAPDRRKRLNERLTQLDIPTLNRLNYYGDIATFLIPLLSSADWQVAHDAAERLGELKIAGAVPGLLRLTFHREGAVKVTAVEAIGKIGIGTRDVVDRLNQLTNDKHLRAQAVDALAEVSEPPSFPAPEPQPAVMPASPPETEFSQNGWQGMEWLFGDLALDLLKCNADLFRSIFGNQVVTIGGGPIDEAAFDDFLMGCDVVAHAVEGDVGDIRILIVGRTDWTEKQLDDHLDATGAKVRVYSHELVLLSLAMGLDVLIVADRQELLALGKDHPALNYLIESGFDWPEVGKTVSLHPPKPDFPQEGDDGLLKKHFEYRVGRRSLCEGLRRTVLVSQTFSYIT